MKRKSKISEIEINDFNYVYNCWKKFVELTPTEINNLKQMAQHQKAVIMDTLKNTKRKILWITVK